MSLYGALAAMQAGASLAAGTHVVTTAEAGATVPQVDIITGLGAIISVLVQFSGPADTAGDTWTLEDPAHTITISAGTISINNSAVTAEFMAAGDVARWMAVGTPP